MSLKKELGLALVSVLRKQKSNASIMVTLKGYSPILIDIKSNKQGIHAIFKQPAIKKSKTVYKKVRDYKLYSLNHSLRYTPLNFCKEFQGVKTDALDFLLEKIAIYNFDKFNSKKC